MKNEAWSIGKISVPKYSLRRKGRVKEMGVQF